jgi:cysteine synthase A
MIQVIHLNKFNKVIYFQIRYACIFNGFNIFEIRIFIFFWNVFDCKIVCFFFYIKRENLSFFNFLSKERKKMISSFGAELIQVEEGAFGKAISLRDDLCSKNGWFTTNQFHSDLNIECHYSTTGKEIVQECMRACVNPVAIICGTGTGGTMMGIKNAVKEVWKNTKIIAVEPRESPVMSGGSPGLHGIQGIGDGSKYLVDLKEVDEIIKISTKEAFEECAYLSKTKGLFLGISSGANSLASKRWAEKNNLNENDVVITILCDRGERYFSTL